MRGQFETLQGGQFERFFQLKIVTKAAVFLSIKKMQTKAARSLFNVLDYSQRRGR